MHFLPLIESKRDGQALSSDAIRDLVHAYTASQISEYQMAAFLMAVYFRGLNVEETRALTLALRDSGDVLRFPDDPRPLVDKHSTGGVGDKVSLPLVPLLACLGFRVPMISGRALGITGGTLDKLESIPGFAAALSSERIIEQVQTLGCAMAGQTDRMVPADKALYALRDVTATVPSIPLITASILSKKLAENLDALVLDVKFGCAAFMQTRAQARQLAEAMVTLGNECGVNTRALLSDMNTPLGRTAGNWLEVKESVACLEGRAPDDLRQLVIDCAAHLLVQTHRAATLEEGRAQAVTCLRSGEPRRKWDAMLAAQGADLAACERQLALDHTAPVVREIRSDHSGFVSRCDARLIGEVIRELGGGRLTKDTVIDPSVGVDELAKPGQSVRRGDLLVRVHAGTEEQADAAVARVGSAFTLGDKPPAAGPLVPEALSG
jgi:pyrimidine-nucleoside phosphorylase